MLLRDEQRGQGLGRNARAALAALLLRRLLLDSERPAATPSLFPGLVLGCINADFRVQVRILQHFSRSTRKSSSRKQFCKNFRKFSEFCKMFENFLESFGKFQKISANLQDLTKLCRIFHRILQNFVDFEKC